MPNIPTYVAQKQIPASSGLVRVDVAAAGAPGRALIQQSRALMGVATPLGEIAGMMKMQENASAVSNGNAELEEFTRTLQYGSSTAATADNIQAQQYLGALAAEGEAAFGIYENAKKSLDGKVSEISRRLANDDQRRDFEARAQITSRAVLNSISRHEAQERAKAVLFTADTDLQRTLRLAAENAEDQETVGGLVQTHIESLKQILPNRPDVYTSHYAKIIAAQAEGLAGKKTEVAHKLADGLKEIIPYDTYLKLKQSIDVKEVQYDAHIDPAGTMLKMSLVGDDGVFKFYRTLPLEKRLNLMSSIHLQMEHQQSVLKRQRETVQEELKSQIFDLVKEGKTLEAEQQISQWSRERKIDFSTAKTLADFLRADSKISDPEAKLDTWYKVLNGGISSKRVKELAIQGDLSADDAISMMKKIKEISQNAAQASALRSLSSRTVIDEARRIIDPGGILSTPETKVQMMKFASDFEKASKGQGFDPVEFWNDNGWKYTQGSVPSLWDGSRPKTLDDVAAAKQRLTRSRLSVSKQNIEAEKIRHAEKVLREAERIRNNARNKQPR